MLAKVLAKLLKSEKTGKIVEKSDELIGKADHGSRLRVRY